VSQRWNYQVIEIKPGLMGGFNSQTVQEELTRQGIQGWELVQIVVSAPVRPLMLVFKRPG